MRKTTATVEQLRSAIENVDYQSQTAFTRISALAGLVSVALRNPGTAPTAHIQSALEQIQYLCTETEDEINNTAEEVGCPHSQ